jgi:hypothetical protein
MAQPRGPGQPRRVARAQQQQRRRGAAAGKRPTAPAARTGTGMVGGAFAGHLYWADGADTIWAANLDGSNPQPIVSGQNSATGVAVDATHLYWGNNNDGSIWWANLDGSSPRVLVSGGPDAPAGVAVDASRIYWANFVTDDSTIRAANLDGSDPHTLVSGQNFPFGLAVDASHLYWANNGDGTIHQANLDGSNPQTLVSDQPDAFGVAVDAHHLYWTNRTQGTIWWADLDGSNPQPIVVRQNAPQGVAVDDRYLYWANLNGGSIWQANLDGSDPQTLATGLDGPQLLAIAPPSPVVLGFTPASYDYGKVAVGQTPSQAFTLANSGGQATGPLTVTVADADAFTTTGDHCTGTSLEPGQSCTVNVHFAPTSPGTVAATLTAVSKDPTATATVALTGTTEPLTLGFTPSSYNFGQVLTGQTPSQAVILANSGGQASGPLTVTLRAPAFSRSVRSCGNG